MNQNDKFKPPQKDRFTVSIPVHKVWNWYRDWRIRKSLNNVKEYEDVVRDYRQDQ